LLHPYTTLDNEIPANYTLTTVRADTPRALSLTFEQFRCELQNDFNIFDRQSPPEQRMMISNAALILSFVVMSVLTRPPPPQHCCPCRRPPPRNSCHCIPNHARHLLCIECIYCSGCRRGRVVRCVPIPRQRKQRPSGLP
jgi:hypothetical protein